LPKVACREEPVAMAVSVRQIYPIFVAGDAPTAKQIAA
jgi:hypothetical protein